MIVTTTMVDIRRVVIPKHLNDDKYYKRRRGRRRGPMNSGDILTRKSYQVPVQRREDQHTVDSQLLFAIGNVPHLSGYLKSMFSLSKKQNPHELVF